MPSKAFFFIYGFSAFQSLPKGKMTTDFLWALGSILSQILKCKDKNMFAESGEVDLTAVFQVRDGSQVKNPTATATWPGTDENKNPHIN